MLGVIAGDITGSQFESPPVPARPTYRRRGRSPFTACPVAPQGRLVRIGWMAPPGRGSLQAVGCTAPSCRTHRRGSPKDV